MDNIEEKQEYLRNKILDNNYDADEFMAYLQEKKGEDGTDLNTWSFSELKLTVEEFISKYKSNNNKNNEQININDYPIENINENNENLNNNNNEEINNNINDNKQKPVNEIILCKTNDTTKITNINHIKINLGYPLVVEGGFFSRSYVTYSINTIPLNLNVRKRYSDFEWLKNFLSNIYPQMVIPPMPKKNFGYRFNEELISKRLRALEKFLNGISIHPLLRSNEAFYDFLSINNEDDFNNKKNEYNKIESPKFINDFKTKTGFIKISLSNDKEEYFKLIKENCLNYQINLSNITKAYKNLINTMISVSDQMKNISEIWKSLGKMSEQYNDNQNTIDSFYALNKLMSDWSDIEKKTSSIINIQIREHFRYIKNELNSLEKLVNKVEKNKNTFIKNYDYLLYKKNNLFQSQNIDNWELENKSIDNITLLKNKDLAFSLMLPNETKNIINDKNLYSFYLNNLIEEYERLKELNGIRNRRIVKSFTKEIINNLASFHVYLAECTITQFQLDETEELEEMTDQNIIEEYQNRNKINN